MKPEARALLRRQLDQQLSSLESAPLARPRRGWVRAIREALGMNGRQLAERMGIARSHLSQIEDAEARGSVSLQTLRRAADALGCDLVYAFVPRDVRTLDEMVHARARAVAERIVGDVSTTMALEAQSVAPDFQRREVGRVASERVHSMRRDLWNQ